MNTSTLNPRGSSMLIVIVMRVNIVESLKNSKLEEVDKFITQPRKLEYIMEEDMYQFQ
jgi:hypothetical protein